MRTCPPQPDIPWWISPSGLTTKAIFQTNVAHSYDQHCADLSLWPPTQPTTQALSPSSSSLTTEKKSMYGLQTIQACKTHHISQMPHCPNHIQVSTERSSSLVTQLPNQVQMLQNTNSNTIVNEKNQHILHYTVTHICNREQQRTHVQNLQNVSQSTSSPLPQKIVSVLNPTVCPTIACRFNNAGLAKRELQESKNYETAYHSKNPMPPALPSLPTPCVGMYHST